jgi:hypothetical protein
LCSLRIMGSVSCSLRLSTSYGAPMLGNTNGKIVGDAMNQFPGHAPHKRVHAFLDNPLQDLAG